MRSGVRLLFPVLACVLSATHAHLCWAAEATAESLLKDAVGKIRDLDSHTVEFVRYDESVSSRSLHQRISIHSSFRCTPVWIASRHNIAPQTEHFPMSKINEAFARLESGKARYRSVLDADF